MVLKSEFVINNRVVGVVRFEQVLERAWSALRCRFDVVNCYGWEVNGRVVATVCIEEREFEGWYGEHLVFGSYC